MSIEQGIKGKEISFEQKKEKEINFKTIGVAVGGGLLCSNLVFGLMGTTIPYDSIFPIAAASVTCGVLLDQLFRKDKYGDLFRMCGLVNKDKQVPIVIKQHKKGIKTTLVIHLPNGIAQHDFEKNQQELEQALNCKINFGFNKNLIMECVDMNLSSKYLFKDFEEQASPTEVFIGYSHDGKFIFDIEKATQIIVAGEPNSGKSSLLRTLILSLILSKYEIDLHLIDFQGVELGIFDTCKKVRSYGETPEDFKKLLDEMEKESERRLKLFRSVKDKVYIQKLSVWNQFFPEKALPYKVCIIDEFARLAEEKYKYLFERFRNRVAMDRKVGIHYIASLQRPSVDIISGSVKGNMCTRVAFKTVSDTDSEVILDIKGAEQIKLQGRCLMKYLGEFKEVQVLYLENEEVRKFLKKYNRYKSKEELEAEQQQEIDEVAEKRRKQIEEWRKTNSNPY